MSKTPTWSTPELLQELGQTIYEAIGYTIEWKDLLPVERSMTIRAARAVLNKLYKVIEQFQPTPQVCTEELDLTNYLNGLSTRAFVDAELQRYFDQLSKLEKRIEALEQMQVTPQVCTEQDIQHFEENERI